MTTANWILVVLTVLWVSLVAGFLISGYRTPAHGAGRKHPLVAQSVVVQLKDGSAVAGLLTRRAAQFLVLENARLYENGGDVPVDGSAWVPTDQVRWIQQARYQDGGER